MASMVLAAACDGDSAAPPAAIPRVSPPVSAAVTDCGTFSLAQGDDLPVAAVRCLIGAVDARHPARLVATSPSVEGGPILVTYFAGADGDVEVITDSRQDPFGSAIPTRMTCTGPTETPAAATVIFALCSERTALRD